MNRSQLLEQFFETLRTVFARAHSVVRPPLNHHELSKAQLGVVFLVSRSPKGLSLKELIAALHVTPGAATQLVDGLVEQHILERIPDTADRRSIHIQLSPAGKTRITAFKQRFIAELTPLFVDLTDAELTTLIAQGVLQPGSIVEPLGPTEVQLTLRYLGLPNDPTIRDTILVEGIKALLAGVPTGPQVRGAPVASSGFRVSSTSPAPPAINTETAEAQLAEATRWSRELGISPEDALELLAGQAPAERPAPTITEALGGSGAAVAPEPVGERGAAQMPALSDDDFAGQPAEIVEAFRGWYDKLWKGEYSLSSQKREQLAIEKESEQAWGWAGLHRVWQVGALIKEELQRGTAQAEIAGRIAPLLRQAATARRRSRRQENHDTLMVLADHAEAVVAILAAKYAEAGTVNVPALVRRLETAAQTTEALELTEED